MIEHAPGAPGIPPTWTSSTKDMVGCALGSSRLWFTLGFGIVNEVCESAWNRDPAGFCGIPLIRRSESLHGGVPIGADCRRGQVDGTAGLPSAPEMPCAPQQLRLVPGGDTSHGSSPAIKALPLRLL